MKNKIILVCTDCGSRNYSFDRSEEASSKRLELRKFCKNCNVHTIHKETK